MGLRKAHRLIRLCDESCELVLDGGEPQYNRARMNRGGFLNTNVSNLSNVGECVFFFPSRMILILAGWAALTCIRVIRIDSCEARIELFLQLASQPHSKNSFYSC